MRKTPKKKNYLFDGNIKNYSIAQLIELERKLEGIIKSKSSNGYIETQIHNLHQAFIALNLSITHLQKIDKSNEIIKEQLKIMRKTMKVLRNEYDRF